jgi:hypothetical protein
MTWLREVTGRVRDKKVPSSSKSIIPKVDILLISTDYLVCAVVLLLLSSIKQCILIVVYDYCSVVL